MKTKRGRKVTKKTWNLYEQMYKYRPDSDSKTTIKIVYGKEADEIKKAFDDVIDEHTDDYGMPKPTNYGERDTIEVDEQGFIKPPKMKEHIKPPKVMVSNLEVPRHLMEYTLKVIEEIRKKDNLRD